MFEEKELTIDEILKINDGIISLINSERVGSNEIKPNMMPLKTSYKVGRFADYLENPVKRFLKIKDQANEKARKIVDELQEKSGSEFSRKEYGVKVIDEQEKQIESILKEKDTVMVLSKPLTEGDFDGFHAPAYALKQLGDFVKFE